MAKVAERYALGPTRVQFQNKNPRAWAEFAPARRALDQGLGADHARRAGATALAVGLTDAMKALRVPTLILTGDEMILPRAGADDEARDPGRRARGHALRRAHHQHRGLTRFNRQVFNFLTVEMGPGRRAIRAQ